jgi:hypothetical protein
MCCENLPIEKGLAETPNRLQMNFRRFAAKFSLVLTGKSAQCIGPVYGLNAENH